MNVREFAGYDVIRPLGGGGMTRLLLALDAHHRHVVIRYLLEEFAPRWRYRRQFFRGAKVIQNLNHPHVVRLIKTGYHGRIPYMVLEYIEAKTLRDLLLAKDRLLTDNTLSFMRQLAALLSYIHSAGYLHLDFKPENLLVRQDGVIFVIDFDLARPIHCPWWWHRRMRELPGTPAYMAPEVLQCHMVDVRSDIYSLGMVFYEMLTFHKPYESNRIEQELAAQANPAIPPTKPRQYNAQIAPALEQVVLKCLAKRPEDRYSSISLVIRDMEAIL
ncbi:MAG: serine/threonine protein kinase [Verrucomicrobia bacterium]|nr:MAG: serine/threonine protein kinase [Verrucomicrobiota bacterium]